MSSAVVTANPTQLPSTQEDIIGERAIRIPPNNPSSTKAELYAIYAALLITDKRIQIRINTDSKCSLDIIKNKYNAHLTERNLLKINNHFLIEAIRDEIKRFQHKPIFIKVKAHTGVELNERADY